MRAAREAADAKIKAEMERQAALAAATGISIPNSIPSSESDDPSRDDTKHAASVLAKVKQLRDQCHGRPYVDREFGGEAGVGDPKYDAAPVWARMSEMSASPSIVEGGEFSPDRLTQGSLGDCWFISALAALASHDGGKYLKRVLLTPEIDPTGAGVYAVRFWKNGHCTFFTQLLLHCLSLCNYI